MKYIDSNSPSSRLAHMAHTQDFDLRQLTRELLQATLGGQYSAHKEDSVLLLSESWAGYSDEGVSLELQDIPEVLLNWAKLDASQGLDVNELLVLDVETTGLGRGNTLSFLIGLGYFEDGNYVVEQILLPEPDAELNSFDRLIELLESHSVLVTFNGKSFDIPVLESRLLYHRIWLNLAGKDHIDLLHMARRLWKSTLPSCALESLEYYVMGVLRDPEFDIDGGMIPQAYNHYLVYGDVEPLLKIVKHNQLDIIYTMALMVIICDAIRLPMEVGKDPRVDYHAVAKLYLSQGQTEVAKQILREMRDLDIATVESVHELGQLCKRDRELEAAQQCFEYGAALLHPPSLLALAIILEQKRDFEQALKCTEELLRWQQSLPLPDLKTLHEIDKRRIRLQRKISKSRPEG